MLRRSAPISATVYKPEDLAVEGVMGSVQPTREQLADIEFGWPLLLEIVEIEVGLSIAVRERDVIAVEAAESTGSLLERATHLCRAKGWVLLKSSAPAAAPTSFATIDVETVELLAAGGGGCIAVAAQRVALSGKAAVLDAADRAKIALLGVPDPEKP